MGSMSKGLSFANLLPGGNSSHNQSSYSIILNFKNTHQSIETPVAFRLKVMGSAEPRVRRQSQVARPGRHLVPAQNPS